MMMFWREVFQPLDVTLGTLKIDPPKKEVSQYIKELVNNLGKIHDTARENLKAKQERQMGLYDLKNYQTVYSVGDVAYKRNQATKVGQSTKLQSPWKGPYLITAVKPPVLYRITDRKSESWIHHDRLKLCEDRELPIWLKRQRNELLSETVENKEFDFTGLFEEDDAAMSASDPLMSHTGSDYDNASASNFLLGQIDNGQGSASAPDLLVSRGAVDNNELPEKLNIIDRKIIKDLNELHDKTINLNETFLYSVNDNHTEETGRSLLHSREQRRTRRRPAYLDEFVE